MGSTIIFLVFFVALIIFLVFFVIQFYNIFFRGFAPFVATKRKVIKRIVNEFEIGEDTKIYELGCGRAGFLRAVRKIHPGVELVGIEYSFLPYLIGQIQNAFTRSNLKIKKKNFFKVDLSEADVIYCYLNGDMMKKLSEKFKKECKEGAMIISYMFPIHDMEPAKVMSVENSSDKVYFYKT